MKMIAAHSSSSTAIIGANQAGKMIWCNSTDDAANCVDAVRFEIVSAINKLKSKYKDSGGLTGPEMEYLNWILDVYEKKLRLVAAAIPAGKKKQATLAKKHLLCSLHARIFAVIRAIAKSKSFKKPSGKTIY